MIRMIVMILTVLFLAFWGWWLQPWNQSQSNSSRVAGKAKICYFGTVEQFQAMPPPRQPLFCRTVER